MSTRGYCVTRSQRELRRKQADLRNEEYNKLSLQEKLERLPVDGAKRQRARLEAAMSGRSQPSKKEGQ
jgi:hypothetical protein